MPKSLLFGSCVYVRSLKCVIVITSLKFKGDGRFADRLFVCSHFVVSRFSLRKSRTAIFYCGIAGS